MPQTESSATRHYLNAFWMNYFIIGEHISESVQVERDMQLKVPLCLVFMDQKNDYRSHFLEP